MIFWDQIVFVALTLMLAIPSALYITRVFHGRPTLLDPLLRPLERALYRIAGVRPDQGMSAQVYFACFCLLGVLSTLLLFALLMAQRFLPGPPGDAFLTTPMTADLAANAAISFATTSTWQAYAGESTLRYAIQVLGLVSQNFIAGAAGLAMGVAFMRGFAAERSDDLGNFWVDTVRAVLWLLLPFSIAGGLFLVWQGVPQNFAPYVRAATLEGGLQTIAQGPLRRWNSSRIWAPTAAGFSTPTAPIPMKTPPL